MVRSLSALILASIALGQTPAEEAKPAGPRGGEVRRAERAALAQELMRRFRSDQEARKELIGYLASHKLVGKVEVDKLDPLIAAGYKLATGRVRDEDRRNIAWMKEVVAKHGWPGKSLVGFVGAQNAWLLVQHADDDR